MQHIYALSFLLVVYIQGEPAVQPAIPRGHATSLD